MSNTTKDEVAATEDVLRMLKKVGVKCFTGFGIGVEFFPAKSEEAQSESEMTEALKQLTDSEPMCRCGHAMSVHQGGFCLNGCEAGACAPKE